jgi:hypothetical protein
MLAVPLLAFLFLGAPACTVLNDLDREQCSTDDDCRQRGGAFAESLCRQSVCVTDPVWGCLGKVNWPEPIAGGKVTARLHLEDLLTTVPITDATARMCSKLDTACEMPIAAGFTSDQEGILSVEMDKHFDGFIEISSPTTLSPLLYFFYPPVDQDRDIPYVPLVPPAAFFKLAEQTNAGIKFDRGAAIAISYDCSNATTPGLQFSVDRDETKEDLKLPFFMEKGLPSLTAIETDVSGQGGFINVDPGIRRLSAARRQNGAHVGTVSVVVRPGLITYTTMVPTPD